MENLFKRVFDTEFTTANSLKSFLLCMAISVICGLVIALSYMIKNRYTKSFAITVAILPAVVCVVIMMVNGNVGTGVAVAGAFSLVRFRSAPGSAKEIGIIFLTMGAGLIAGMGYLAYAVLFTVIMCLIFIVYNCLGFGSRKTVSKNKILTIIIPESLNYSEIFEDIFQTYTKSHNLVRVKTTNMGSMFKLTYNITVKDIKKEKEMIDMLRVRNGNLEISVSDQEFTDSQL